MEKSRETPKASLCVDQRDSVVCGTVSGSLVQRELAAVRLTEGLCSRNLPILQKVKANSQRFTRQSLRLAFARHLPLHKGGLGSTTNPEFFNPAQWVGNRKNS